MQIGVRKSLSNLHFGWSRAKLDQVDEGREGYRANGVDALSLAFRRLPPRRPYRLRAFYPSARQFLKRTLKKKLTRMRVHSGPEHFVHDE